MRHHKLLKFTEKKISAKIEISTEFKNWKNNPFLLLLRGKWRDKKLVSG